MNDPRPGLDALAQDPKAGPLLKNKELLQSLAQSSDAQALLGLLNREGGLRSAAQSASQGDLSALARLVKQAAGSAEGARLMRQLREKIDRTT